VLFIILRLSIPLIFVLLSNCVQFKCFANVLWSVPYRGKTETLSNDLFCTVMPCLAWRTMVYMDSKTGLFLPIFSGRQVLFII